MMVTSDRSVHKSETLISLSSFDTTRCIRFISFSADDQIRDVQKPVQHSALEGYRIVGLNVRSTAAVAKFRSTEDGKKTVFVALNFKPE